jgi:hypothetical protein
MRKARNVEFLPKQSTGAQMLNSGYEESSSAAGLGTARPVRPLCHSDSATPATPAQPQPSSAACLKPQTLEQPQARLGLAAGIAAAYTQPTCGFPMPAAATKHWPVDS